MTRFSMYWPKEDRHTVVAAWMKQQSRLPETVTSFCRLSVPYDQEGQRGQTVRMGGLFYGGQREAARTLGPLLDTVPDPEKVEYAKLPRIVDRDQAASSDLARWLQEAITDLVKDLQPPVPMVDGKPPAITCDQPHPHKVSSAFATDDADWDRLARQIDGYLETTPFDPHVHRYVSLHSLGGAIARHQPKDTAFFFRQRALLLQFQAWWSTPDEPTSQADQERIDSYIRWVTDLRRSLDDIDGAFINFVDASLVDDPKTQREALLRHYYGKNLDRLMAIKRRYDPNDVLRFEMSIPPA